TCVKGVLLVVTLGWGLSSIAEFIAIQSAVGTGFRNAYHLFELTWLILLASLSFKTEHALEQRRAASIEFNKQPPKTTSTLLTKAQQKDVAQVLKNEMQNNLLFLDPELTLSALAKRTELREQMISETLNSYLEQNFFEFVNSYRIHYACERIKDASTSISNIAIEAGFNSRTTFYSAFKRIKGCTPSEYRIALANHKTCSNGTI
ncbi:MAG: helix-turn-helix transcriptional regulator, partial [Pseudomonadota bacterium]